LSNILCEGKRVDARVHKNFQVLEGKSAERATQDPVGAWKDVTLSTCHQRPAYPNRRLVDVDIYIFANQNQLSQSVRIEIQKKG